MLGFPLLAQTALAAGDPDKSVRIFTAAASFPWAFVRSLERLLVLLLSWQTFGEQTVVEGRSVVLLKTMKTTVKLPWNLSWLPDLDMGRIGSDLQYSDFTLAYYGHFMQALLRASVRFDCILA